jgi:hypothetical protein
MKFKLLACIVLVSLSAVPFSTTQARATETPLVLMVNGDLWSYTEATASLTQLTHWGHNEVPVMSPDNRHVAYTSISEIALGASEMEPDLPINIWVWDIPSGRAERLATQPTGAVFGNIWGWNRFIRRTTPAWSPDGTMLTWVEETVWDHDGTWTHTYALIIYDYVRHTVRASVPITPASLIAQVVTFDPQWGASGIAVRVPIVVGSTPPGTFMIYDAAGKPTAEIKDVPEDEGDAVFHYFFATQNGQEYLTIAFTSGKRVLVNPVDGSILMPQGIPILSSTKTADTVAAHYTLNLNPNPGPDLMGNWWSWEARYGGQSVPFSIGAGFPTQIAIAPSGQAVAYEDGDAVYILRGGQLTHIAGTERAPGMMTYVAWGYMQWHIPA